MTDNYTWNDFFTRIKRLSEIPKDKLWIVPLNPNLSKKEQKQICCIIDWLSTENGRR
jgi:hypothetical protein